MTQRAKVFLLGFALALTACGAFRSGFNIVSGEPAKSGLIFVAAGVLAIIAFCAPGKARR